MNPLEAPLGGLQEAAHLLDRARLQSPERQTWAAREAIEKLDEVIALLRLVADGETPSR